MKRDRNKTRRKQRQLKKVKKFKANQSVLSKNYNSMFGNEWYREFLDYAKLQFATTRIGRC